MEDSKIIDLYWARKEQALAETDAKYGSYCRTIARNILRNFEDTEECVSDTWLHAWNSMPPQRPGILSAFLGRITRNLSFDRCKYQQAAKRGGGALPLALDELGECIPSAQRVEYALEQKELAAVIEAGSPVVSAGSSATASGTRRGSMIERLTLALRSETTAAIVTSEPVPAVVGTA